MNRRRVVVTGMGMITPVGVNAQETWSNIQKGICGIAPIKQFDITGYKATLAGEVKDFKPEDYLDKKELRHMDRYTQFAMIAAKEAMEDSGLDMDAVDKTRCGTIVSSGIGGLSTTENEHNRGLAKSFDRISPFYIPMSIANMSGGEIAIAYGLQGMCTAPVAACAGGTNAVGDAFRHIRDGYAEVMVTGGAEATICPMAVGGFTSMRALCTGTDPMRASIPFDVERSGFVMGEGSGILVLEELEHALARNAKIYGEVVGYGATCDAYHMTAPAPNGAGGARAMAGALADAGIAPEEVDYINAHGTSTPLNDAGECAAIRTCFGDHAEKLMVSSTKSMTGHMLGAAGAVEAIFSILALKDGYVPATINHNETDPACNLDIVPNQGRKVDISVAMSNSLGFGGHNATVVMKKWVG
ncbi:MAG: beta-ketoacyl-ACP synthase II [Eubacteriales bacterium]